MAVLHLGLMLVDSFHKPLNRYPKVVMGSMEIRTSSTSVHYSVADTSPTQQL